MYYNLGRHKKKTVDYLQYQNDIRDEIGHLEWPFSNDPVGCTIVAGLSNKTADLDNIIKPLLDTLQVIYPGFNDNKVYYLELHKAHTTRGNEFLSIRIERLIGTIQRGEGENPSKIRLQTDEVKTTKQES